MSDDYGLLTKIWGPHIWKTLHFISFNYPNDPSYEQKKVYKLFFETLGEVLPCNSCSESYLNLISNGPTKICDEVFENRQTLTKWLFDLHQTVNNKLCVNYGVTYEEICERYESFRAKCNMTTEMKKKAYCNEYKTDCMILPFETAKLFQRYAKIRGINFDALNRTNNIYINKDIPEMKIMWDERNKYCSNIIKEMRQLGISPIETNGEYEGLPTTHELILLSNMSYSMSAEQLTKAIKAIKLLPINKKTYRFSS
jgi:hypothetical protein